MNFELRKVKYHDDMSEETPCFSAELWQDNRFMAYVKNTGRGGCNDITPAKGLTYKDVEHFTDIETECKIFEEVYNADARQKHQSKGFVLLKNDTISLAKFPKPLSKLKLHPDYSRWMPKQKWVYESQGFQVLNNNL